MAGLQPIDDNAQVYSLTTALKNICRDYPAGGTVLRELLQNADDAGATSVRFVLDERSHPTDEFTPGDFKNISKIGDSEKLNDGSTTGRFGRGFNSVYNWTDSPSIVSRDRLLILDPHREWSPGGPVYDFVMNSTLPEIKNQMATFQEVIKTPTQMFNGTVIRIPLRTTEHAIKSRISTRETTVSEIRQVLCSFAIEFGSNGLLFMKNIGKLEISARGLEVGIEIMNSDEVRQQKLDINDAIKCALQTPTHSFCQVFEMEIEYRSFGERTNTKFMVVHMISGDLMETEQRAWSMEQKLVPWVAVAAQLTPERTNNSKGSLYTVLPLPILHNQPVHLHGLFSLSPDRARLYQTSDRNAQDQQPARWNEFLFQGPVPLAWAKLLARVAKTNPNQSAFKNWPQEVLDERDIFSGALSNVMESIEKDSLSVWPTSTGYVSIQGGLLAKDVSATSLQDALREAGVPVVYSPHEIQPLAENLFKDRILCPQTLCHFLKSELVRTRHLSENSKLAILEYVLSQKGFTAYEGLEIFPFEDGTYKALEKGVAYLHRDDQEQELFCHEKSRNIDVQRLTETTKWAIQAGCDASNVHPNIQRRSTKSLKDYCMQTMFKALPQDQPALKLGKDSLAIVSEVWTWISRRQLSILDANICCLWLLPLSGGYYRRIKPQKPSSIAYLPAPGAIGDMMRRLEPKLTTKSFPLLSTVYTGVEPHWLSLVTNDGDLRAQLSIKDANSTVVLLDWLRDTSFLDFAVSDGDRFLLGGHIANHLLPVAQHNAIGNVLRHLKIFQRVSWVMGAKSMERTLSWTSLHVCTESIGLAECENPVPQIDDTQFLLADPGSYANRLLIQLGLAKCLSSIQIIQDYIIPAWEEGKTSKWTTESKEQMASVILRNFSLLTRGYHLRLRSIPFIPTAKLNGEDTPQFARAEDLIDPEVTDLTKLCFEDECIIPKKIFLQDFNAALKGCGLKTALDEAVVEQRVRCYVSSRYSPLQVSEYATRLLKSSCRWVSPLEKQHDSVIQQVAWIPVADTDGTPSLKTSKECRSFKDRPLVSSQLPTLQFFVSNEWNTRLGWDAPLPNEILIRQLAYGTEKKDRNIVEAVLNYISRSSANIIDLIVEDLKDISCVVSTGGHFLKPSLAFCPKTHQDPSCERLQPYLGNVELTFWKKHEKLLTKLGVRLLPQIHDLLKVQAMLEAKSHLEDSDILVAVEILNHGVRFPRDKRAGLKVISDSGKFELPENINFDDISPQKPRQEVLLVHPDVSPSTRHELGIVGLRELLIKRMLELEDVEDETEFEQREEVTTRIRDTLERYSVEATFREYLANADDAVGATKISWRLDYRKHSSENLLMPDMGSLQGPALLVYNDGVFSEADFEGFKKVGEGSKSQNKEAIGQFGRGSQTMYHFSDTPSILSGGHLVILDPQREVLPTNKYTGRRMAGVKMPLSGLREACHDQLSPFEGLWDYTRSLDYYPATIFRFPLRPAGLKSKLRTTKADLDEQKISKLLNDYFDEARISLLFLRKIRSIDFSVIGISGSGWVVSRQGPIDEDAPKSFSELVLCSLNRQSSPNGTTTGKDKWLVEIQDLDEDVEQPNGRVRASKNIECGLAALLSSTYPDTSPIQGRMFNTLPLPIQSDLPVHVHATFSLSGDRQSIAIGEYGTKSQSEVNRNLLQEALPKLYLQFLEELGRQLRADAFRYWPQEKPPKDSPSELLCASLWEKLPESSLQLFPKAQKIEGKPKREAVELFKFSGAVFNFLSVTNSNVLLALLLSLDMPLVGNMPLKVAERLKKIPGIKTVSGAMLQELFKVKTSGLRLKEQMIKSPTVLRVLVEQMIPREEKDFGQLDSCYVLPVADGNIAPLKYLDRENSDVSKYYVVSEATLKLFSFASGYLVTSAMAKPFEPLLRNGKFNLEPLKLHNVKDLLALKPNFSALSVETDSWLLEFWKFWNKDKDSSLPLALSDCATFKIFKAACDGKEIYATPSEFDQLPAIMKPSVHDHQQICASVKGLYIFDTSYMPIALSRDQESLHDEISFLRFVRALRILNERASSDGFVSLWLNFADIKVLQQLVRTHIRAGILDKEYKQFPDVRADLRSLRIWPAFMETRLPNLLSAKTAFRASKNAFLVPWMKHPGRFIDPEFLKDNENKVIIMELEVEKRSIDKLLVHDVLPLPAILEGPYWQSYKNLIETLSGLSSKGMYSNTTLHILRGSSIAANGDGNLVQACKLYDHEDELFQAAFRLEGKSRFLHEQLKQWRTYWLKVGLCERENQVIKAADYLECLKLVARRLRENFSWNPDPHLTRDSLSVLKPLISPDVSIRYFNAADWQSLSNEKVFTSRTVFPSGSEYRQTGMSAVALQNGRLCLSDIISQEYLPVCWSQTPFPTKQPTVEVLSHVTGTGRPTSAMVWQHLEHMMNICKDLNAYEVEAFLEDLYRTYDHLSNNLHESTADFNDRKEKNLWLNLDSKDHRLLTMDVIRSSWCSINHLVLSSSCDAEPMKAVRSSLSSYEILLKELGCAQVFHPFVERPATKLGYSLPDSLRALRDAGKLLDIAYFSEGRTIHAHRIVLAAASAKCAAQFSGPWKVEDVITYSRSEDPENFISHHSLSIMISYAYGDFTDWASMSLEKNDTREQQEEKLELLLDLLKAADAWFMPGLKSLVEDEILIGGRAFRTEENVLYLWETVSEIGGVEGVKKMCKDFVQKNEDLLKAIHDEERVNAVLIG